jgi:glycosyltransferase involved in cell wall biosynthesis
VTAVRIVHLIATSGGGVGRHVRTVVAGLSGAGIETVVAAPARACDDFAFAEAGATTVPVELGDRPRPLRDLRAVLAVRRLTGRADLLHAHGVRAGAVAVLAARMRLRRRRTRAGALARPAAAPARPAAAPGAPDRAVPGTPRPRRGPAVVVTVHNTRPEGRFSGAVHALLEWIVARGADAVLVVSPDLERRMRELRARRVSRALVPAAVPRRRRESDRVRAELGVSPGTVLLVTVARLAPQKGLPDLLDALALLTGEGTGPFPEPAPGPASGPEPETGPEGAAAGVPPLFAVIAGEGPLGPDLDRRIRAGNLPVALLGARDDAADLIAAADVVVLPSRWEGQPLVVQEALHLGAALVATDAGGTAQVSADAAMLVPPGDPVALAAALARLRVDPATRNDLGERARRRAAVLPTREDLLTQLRTLYTGLLPASRG